MNLCSHRPIHFITLGVLFWIGCGGPSIKQFDIQPQILCEGQTATMQWRADGDLSMTFRLEPPRAGEQECAVEGFDTYALTLVARKGEEEAIQKVELGQLRPGATEPILLPATSMVDSDVVASGEKNAKLWDGRMEVATVAACRQRPILVQHGGKTMLLPADGTPSAELAGTTLGGSWDLRSPLSLDEQQNPARRPKTLQVLATLRCREEKR
jgi:hypothetical protein